MFAKENVQVSDVYQFLQTLDPKSRASLNEYIGGHNYYDRARTILGLLPDSFMFHQFASVARLCETLGIGGSVINVGELAFDIALTGKVSERFSHASKYLQARATFLAGQFKDYIKERAKGRSVDKFDFNNFLTAKAELLAEGKIQKAKDRAAEKNRPKRPLTEAQVAAIKRRQERKALYAAFDVL